MGHDGAAQSFRAVTTALGLSPATTGLRKPIAAPQMAALSHFSPLWGSSAQDEGKKPGVAQQHTQSAPIQLPFGLIPMHHAGAMAYSRGTRGTETGLCERTEETSQQFEHL
jgi:hypothetical protein